MFEPFEKPLDWTGHYDKPLTRESVFHVSQTGKIRICLNKEWDRYLYEAVMDSPAQELARWINECKKDFSYNCAPGGSFCINEFGIVLVPISTGGDGYVPPKAVGRWTGTLRFRDGGKVFSLNDDENLSPGANWPYPYLGMKYHLAQDSYIYYSLYEDDGKTFPRAPQGNQEIIRRLRGIRGGGSVSFVINNHGVVLVRRNDNDDNSAVYVGRIDMNSWYHDPLRTKNFSDVEITLIITALNQLDRRGWKDRFEYERILNTYWKNGRRIPNVGMKQSLLAIARNHHLKF